LRGKERPARRSGKSAKAQVEAKLFVRRKAPKSGTATVRDLEKRLAEALEQQKATAEILRIISGAPTGLEPVLDAIARNAALVCGAYDALVFLREGDGLRYAAHHGPINITLEHTTLSRGSITEACILDRRPVHVHDLLATEPPAFPLTAKAAREGGFRTGLSVPLLRESEAIGALSIRRREVQPFTAEQIALLQTFADQAVIAIENVRLFTELQEKNRALMEAHAQVSEALEQQTATSEILRVISSSPTDVQPVFNAIVRSASRLCGGEYAIVTRYDGRLLHLAALYNPRPGTADETATFFPQLPRREESPTARALVDAEVIHIADVESERLGSSLRERYRKIRLRAIVAVPMFHEGGPIGVIWVSRETPGRFSDRQIALLQTFADQAVIAIENVRLFKELESVNRDLAAASQHKSEFLANMSHELRTPLNAVIGFSEVLSEGLFGELNAKQEEYARDIHASGQHLLSLINDILDLSKIEAGRMELELTEFDLPTAIENALILVRERAGRRGIALETGIDERLGQLQADERKIRQVILNLLSNAIKFTPEGGRIGVTARLSDSSVEIFVSDTGIGIAPEDQEAVFEEFRQVGRSDKKAEGTGLGLTLCRKFIELHGGRIWVVSEPGSGSTFTFAIPMHQDASKTDG